MRSNPQPVAAWREWLARKLDPGVYARAERGWYLETQLDELHCWGAEFPLLRTATSWLRATVEAYFRDVGDLPDKMPLLIDDFFAELERTYPDQHRLQLTEDVSSGSVLGSNL